MNLSNLAKKTIAYLEDLKTPLVNYILIFLAVIAVRIFLEFFSDTAMMPSKFLTAFFASSRPDIGIAISIAHYYFFWIVLWLSFILAATLVTKENIAKVTRAMLGVSWMIIITPLYDLLVSKGKGIPIKYITPESFAVMFPFPGAVNPGEKITIIFGLILLLIYCLVKTRSILKTSAGMVMVYILSLLSFIPPFLMQTTARLVGIELKVSSPIPLIRMLLIFSFIELAIISYIWNKEKFISLVKQIEPVKALHFVLFFIMGMLLYTNRIEVFILHNFGSFILAVMAVVFAWITAVMLNSDDRITAGIMFLSAAICAISINFMTFFIVMLTIAVSSLYCLDPVKLKRIPLFSGFPIAVNIFLLILLGWLFSNAELQKFHHIFTVYILIFFTLSLNIFDMQRITAILGKDGGKILVGTFLFITYLLIPQLFLEKLLYFPSLIVGIIQFLLIIRKTPPLKAILAVNLSGLIPLLLWLNFIRNACPHCTD